MLEMRPIIKVLYQFSQQFKPHLAEQFSLLETRAEVEQFLISSHRPISKITLVAVAFFEKY